MELWTRRIPLPVFHRPPLEVHALLVDRPQILIIEFAKTALPGAAPSPIYAFKPHVSSQNVEQMYCWLSMVIQSSPSLLHLLFVLFIIANHPESVVGMDIYNYSHHYNSWNSLFPTPTYHIVRVIGLTCLSFSQRSCSKIAWQIRISPISKNHWITHFFPKTSSP